jgi:hypothetical protein
MKNLRLIERLRGQGMLSGQNSGSIPVAYEIVIQRWIHKIEPSDGVSEAPGPYHIEANLSVPFSATRVMLGLLVQDAEAELVLEDGSRARLVISNPGGLIGSGNGGRVHCHVNFLDGYT